MSAHLWCAATTLATSENSYIVLSENSLKQRRRFKAQAKIIQNTSSARQQSLNRIIFTSTVINNTIEQRYCIAFTMRSNIDTSTASSHDANCVTWIMLCFWWHKIPAHKLTCGWHEQRGTIQQLQQFQSQVYYCYWTAIDCDSEHYWLALRLFCLWKCVTTWLSPPLLTVRSRRDVTPPAATTPNVEHTCCRVQLVWYTLLCHMPRLLFVSALLT